MKFTRSAIIAVVAVALSTTTTSAFVQQPLVQPRNTAVYAAASTKDTVDVSIPYDSAARLSYDQWRKEFKKGSFDEKRYNSFKANYETISVANVVAKKVARENSGDDTPVSDISDELLSFNEFGDFTAEEYAAAMELESDVDAVSSSVLEKAGAAEPPKKSISTGDVLSQAVEAAGLQSVASNALGEAADALAEEELVRSMIANIFYYPIGIFA